MSTQFTTFIDLLALLDLDGFARMPDAREDFFRLKSIREKASVDDVSELLPYLDYKSTHQELVRVFAIVSVRAEHDSPELVHKLTALIKPSKKVSKNIRLAAIQALQRLPSPLALETLITRLISERDPLIKEHLCYAINVHEGDKWEEKLKLTLSKIEGSSYYREHLDFRSLYQALRPPDEEVTKQRYALSHYICQSGKYEDMRMVGIIGGLILEECNYDQSAVIQLTADLINTTSANKAFLEQLANEMRFPMSGHEINSELETNFHQPLRTAHHDFRENWQSMQKTLFRNLTLRFYAMLVFSGFSAALLIISFGVLFVSQRWAEGLIGIVVALGVLIMTFLFYGSMENARQVHFDIGAANTAFLAFIQRSLELSNAFNFLYRHGKLDSQMLQDSENLIGKAMKSSVQEIRVKNRDSLQALLDDLDT